MYQLMVLVATALLVAADQVSKLVVTRCLTDGAVSLWNGVLEFCYSENRGIAWGLLQDHQLPVVIVTGLMLAFLLVVLLSAKFRGSKLVTLGGVMVLAGGIGNLIDRVMNGYVVDFIHYYKWFDFPVFNIADCCVTVGAVLILLYFFFCGNKENEKKEADDGAATTDRDGGVGRGAD